jgi:hypothetical protein
MWLVRVELPWACFGFEVTDDGWVIQAAPIASWTIGRRGRQVVAYYRQRGGLVSWQQVPHRLSYAGHPAHRHSRGAARRGRPARHRHRARVPLPQGPRRPGAAAHVTGRDPFG